MNNEKAKKVSLFFGVLGVATVLLLHYMVFFWVPTESSMGIVQRIFYIHVPSWWVAFIAFGAVALCSGVYLWLGDDRLDAAAVTAALRCGLVWPGSPRGSRPAPSRHRR